MIINHWVIKHHQLLLNPRRWDVQAQTLQAPRHLSDVQAAAVVFVHGFEEASAISDAHPGW